MRFFTFFLHLPIWFEFFLKLPFKSTVLWDFGSFYPFLNTVLNFTEQPFKGTMGCKIFHPFLKLQCTVRTVYCFFRLLRERRESGPFLCWLRTWLFSAKNPGKLWGAEERQSIHGYMHSREKRERSLKIFWREAGYGRIQHLGTVRLAPTPPHC